MLEFEGQKLNKVKIIDFGLSWYSNDLGSSAKDQIRCGTLNYSAPEMVDHD